MTLITTENFDRGVTLELHYDDDAQYADPREYDNLGTMVCWHRRSHLGDQTVNTDHYDAGTAEDFIAEFVRDEHDTDAFEAIPLWLYDHGAMTMMAADHNPYHCPWDSGQVGWVYVTHAKIGEEYGEANAFTIAKAREVMKAEVEEYARWLRGEVYGYVVHGPDRDFPDGSCWGFIGDEEYVLNEGRDVAKHYVEWLANKEARANVAAILAHFGAAP